jgi:F0F1-type ATP synthase membrane subunit b/b'
MQSVGHAATFFLLIGFMVFCWIIYKKTRKVVRKAIKQKRRERRHWLIKKAP